MSRYKEFDEYEELIKERLSKKRFTHSMNVAEACYDLAERFGADKKRCYLAGLLHDTIGCAKMTKLEKIVYLGDMISAERSYKDVDKFRKICRDDLDKAMSVALIYNIGDVCKKCGHLPRYTFEAYNYYLKYNKNKESL